MSYALVSQAANGDFSSYISQVNKMPELSVEQEQVLTRQLAENGDLEAAKQLILSNLRYVVMIARGYAGYGLPQPDLVQEGNVGLMKAVKRFDPQQGVRLMTFAVYWIKAEIHEYVLRNWRIVKAVTTKAQKKLFFNLRKFKQKLHWFNDSEVKQLAQQLNVPEKDVREMEGRLSSRDIAVEIREGQDGAGAELSQTMAEDQLVAHTPSPELILEEENWRQNAQAQVNDLIKQLNPRTRDILVSRWLSEEKATLHQLAEKYQISYERVRQLETEALEGLKASVRF